MNKQVVGTIFHNELNNIFKNTYFELLLTGSIVLGDYVFQKSDIDFVVFINGRISEENEHKLYRLHDMFRITNNILEKLEGVYYEVNDNIITGGVYIGSNKSSWRRINEVIHSILEIDILRKHHYKVTDSTKNLINVFPKFISNNVLRDYLLSINKTHIEKNNEINSPKFTAHAILWAFRSIYFLNNNEYCSKVKSISYIKEKFLFTKHTNLIRTIEIYTNTRDDNTLTMIGNHFNEYSVLLKEISEYFEKYANTQETLELNSIDYNDTDIIINETQKFMQLKFSELNLTKEEKIFLYNHSLRVANIALKLAEKEEANKIVVVLASLLHDVGKHISKDDSEHGKVSASIAREFLTRFSISEEDVNNICYSITAHNNEISDNRHDYTLEAAIVSDADTIDRYGAYRLYKHIQWSTNNYKGNIEKEKSAIEIRVAKLSKMLKQSILQTDSGNKWLLKQIQLQISYYSEYLKEIELTITPRI